MDVVGWYTVKDRETEEGAGEEGGGDYLPQRRWSVELNGRWERVPARSDIFFDRLTAKKDICTVGSCKHHRDACSLHVGEDRRGLLSAAVSVAGSLLQDGLRRFYLAKR